MRNQRQRNNMNMMQSGNSMNGSGMISPRVMQEQQMCMENGNMCGDDAQAKYLYHQMSQQGARGNAFDHGMGLYGQNCQQNLEGGVRPRSMSRSPSPHSMRNMQET